MTRAVIWRRRAEEDVASAYRHIATDSPAAAERFLDRIESTVEMLRRSPAVGTRLDLRPPWTNGLRRWVLREFTNYLVVYRDAPDHLEIVRVLHGARRWIS